MNSLCELCRLCASKTLKQNRIYIFENEGQIQEIYLKMTSCLSVTVSDNDPLPKFVCISCANQLDSCYRFRLYTAKSEEYLMRLVNKHISHESLKEEYTSPVACDDSFDNVDTSISQFCQAELKTKFPSKEYNVIEKAREDIPCEPSLQTKHNEEDRLSPSVAEAHRQEFLRRLSALYAPRKKKGTNRGKSILKKNNEDVPVTPIHNTRSMLRKAALANKVQTNSSSEVYTNILHDTSTSLLKDMYIKDNAPMQCSTILVPDVDTNLPEKPSSISTRSNSRSLLCSNNSKKVSTDLNQQSDSDAKQTPMKLLQCDHCKLLFPSRKVFIGHMKSTHHRVYRCNKCGDTFNTRTQLKVHNKKHIQKLKQERAERKNKKCNVCGKKYLHNKDLRLHERSHTGEKPFSCTYCEKCFSSTSARNKHIQVHEKRWSHVCSYCGKGFVDKIHFVYHVQKHHTGERPFPCTQCEKKFVRKHDLVMHEANMHSTEPRQCYKCEICSKTFTNKSYLKTHTQNHVIPIECRKKFKCNICEAVFCSKRNSIQHMLTHTGELPFECDLCKKRFNNKHGLEIHLLIHSGLKKYVCEVCGKAFALQNTLVCHRRTHTGERPYQCNICDQRFTQKSSLNAHRKRHIKE